MSRLSEIRERAERATPAPWGVDLHCSDCAKIVWGDEKSEPSIVANLVELPEDADFIAQAREDIPRLLEMVEKLIEMEQISRRDFYPAEPKELKGYDRYKQLEASLPDEVKALLQDDAPGGEEEE